MPNKNTFSIKPIKEVIEKYETGFIIDPFANINKIATVTNDLDIQFDTDYHLDALDFLKITRLIWFYMILHTVQDRFQSLIKNLE